jgi:hypothetical protein
MKEKDRQTHGRTDDKQLGVRTRMNTQSALCSDQGGTCGIDHSQEESAWEIQTVISWPVAQWSPRLTDIQRVSRLARDPTGIEEDELFDQLGQLFTVKRGQCDPGGGLP